MMIKTVVLEEQFKHKTKSFVKLKTTDRKSGTTVLTVNNLFRSQTGCSVPLNIAMFIKSCNVHGLTAPTKL